MKLNRAIIVYKEARPGVTGVANHLATLDELYSLLKELGVDFESCKVGQLCSSEGTDLVITVGGDGTVLTTSHYVTDKPILGIKSFGQTSVGYFCGATQKTMRKYIQDLVAGKRKPTHLHRLQVLIDGKPLRELVLNEILFAHALPASMTRYELTVGRRKEEHRSSGVWISTAAGSTAAIYAAGGTPLPITSKQMEYLVREPYYHGKYYRLVQGILSETARIQIRSHVAEGIISIDGSHIQYPAPEGAEITVAAAKHPLKLYWRK
ncbi:MAG: hypothetical protein COV45_09095 [Deltaproteobacteria bacterium CG11_big_fil_rev_8_21_14_0_20_47_16]|nr:MAG: hypothetical protein COV45_09095 [Deltaproteobacteria bacterium CG11_big_fil_rev_8_21_14_0_20_47_16]